MIIAGVVDKFLVELQAQLDDKHVVIDVDELARTWLAEKGYDKQMGARPMARVIQENVKRALADAASSPTAAPAAAARPGVPVRSGPLLPPSSSTGFADTEMPGSDAPSPDLSSTQYGELN